jgi:hypothetical protein
VSIWDVLRSAAAWGFPVLIALAVAYLVKLDRDPTTPFRLVQFISDDQTGRANSGSLAYVAALLVGTWLVYYEAIRGRMTEGLLGLYLGTFVAGQVVRTGIAATQRVGQDKARRPPDPPPAVAVTAETATVEPPR